MRKAIEYSLRAEKSAFEQIRIRYSGDAYEFAKKFWADDILIYESVFIILMSKAYKVIGYAKIGQGGTRGAVVDIKLVAKYAIDVMAAGVILVHYHPSGLAYPSDEDKKLAKNIESGLRLLDVALMDSLIITDSEYYSMKDNNDF
jgi:DNA repair protein RadC